MLQVNWAKILVNLTTLIKNLKQLKVNESYEWSAEELMRVGGEMRAPILV